MFLPTALGASPSPRGKKTFAGVTLRCEKLEIYPSVMITVTPKVEYGLERSRTRVFLPPQAGTQGRPGIPERHHAPVVSGVRIALKNATTGGPKMSAMAGTAARTGGMSKDEKFVIFASSLGTVFEWYDFYLYATLAPFFAALFFPSGQRHGGAALGVRHLCRGLPGAPVRRAPVRPHRRPGRPQIHLPRHHHGDGHRDLRGRPACRPLPQSAWLAPILLVSLAPAAGPGARRRIWRRRDLRRRARAPAQGAAMPRAGSRPRRRSASSCRFW